MMGPMTAAQMREILRSRLAPDGEDPVRVLDQLAEKYAAQDNDGPLEIIESLKRVLKEPRKQAPRKKKKVAKA